ncbi:MAG: hypothetical protein V8R64_03180 [Thomasclavelia sp.]
MEESITALRAATNEAQALIDNQCQDLDLIKEAVKKVEYCYFANGKGKVDKTGLDLLIRKLKNIKKATIQLIHGQHYKRH